VTFRKYLVLAGITLFAATGDSLLSHGMKQVGSISLAHLTSVIFAVLNPSVALGILLLLGFFVSYTTALSWADLTYVLPASSLGYVLLALLALISSGVGFVTQGPALTHRQPGSTSERQASKSFDTRTLP